MTLEPEHIDRRENLADLADIDAMLAAAMSGLSARSRQLERCRWAKWLEDGSLEVTLSCFAWPSRPDLAYSLHLPPGVTAAPPVAVELSRSWKYWVGGSRSIELPWHLEGAQLHWHAAIGCSNEFSEAIAAPAISHQFARIELGGPAYGVLVATGTARGFRHDLSINYSKLATTDEDAEAAPGKPVLNRIEAESISLRATWENEHGEEAEDTAELAIPQCVRELLAACEDGSWLVNGSISHEDVGIMNIYYSTCDGKILARRIVK